MKKSILKKAAITAIVLLAVIQFFKTKENKSVQTSENAITQHYDVPENIQNILKISCYDCHSNNTNYPWYNKIQPVNWWLADHVNEGKRKLNFDEFNTYSTKKKLHKLDEVIETIRENEMPLKSYTLIHGDAKLSDSDKQEIETWAKKIKSEIQ
ncbi:MAG: heme-binding domain-containing protein [Bacteroidetes bacterium]|nr:heme-binding domain-containing protein [Bacteroidota bacterium]MCB0538713.1 heme-binding domain-containing protein [Bacteroidota bacterium]